jgi:hypothetical protein
MKNVIPHDDEVKSCLEKVLKNCSYFISKNKLEKNKKSKITQSSPIAPEIAIADKFDVFFENSESLCTYIQNLYELTMQFSDHEGFIPIFPIKNNCEFAVAGHVYDSALKIRLNPFTENLGTFLYTKDNSSAEFAVAREQLIIDVLFKLCIEFGKNKSRDRSEFNKNGKFNTLTHIKSELPKVFKKSLKTTALKNAKVKQAIQFFPSASDLFSSNIKLKESLSVPENILLAIKIEPLLLKTRTFSKLIGQIPFQGENRFSFLENAFRQRRTEKKVVGGKFIVMKVMLLFKAFEPTLFVKGSNIDKIAAYVICKSIFNSSTKLDTIRQYITTTY